MMKDMITNIDPIKSAIISMASAAAGTISKYLAFLQLGFISLENVNTLFQHLAWTVAILAGIVSIVSIVNGVKWWFKLPSKAGLCVLYQQIDFKILTSMDLLSQFRRTNWFYFVYIEKDNDILKRNTIINRNFS